MQCTLGFSQASDGKLLVLTEVLGNYSSEWPTGFTVTKFSDENIFLYYLVLADLDDDITTSLIANVLLVQSGRALHTAWITLQASERQMASLGLDFPRRAGAGALVKPCDLPNDLHFRDVLMQSPLAVTMMSGPQHEFTFINPAYVRMMGRSSAESVLGKTVREALPELQGQAFYGLLDNVYKTGKPFIGTEVPGFLKNSETGELAEMYFDFIYHPVRDRQGTVCGILCQASDVTERVLERHVSEARESKLYRQWAELEAVYSRSPVGLILVDATDYRLLRLNDMSAAFVDIPVSEAIGKEVFELFPGMEGLRQIYDRVAAGEAVRNVRIDVMNSPDGIPDRQLLLNFSPVRDAYGDIEAIASIAINITETVEPEPSLTMDLSKVARQLVGD